MTITVHELRPRLVKAEDLPLLCRTDAEIEACMELVGQSLRYECRHLPDGWQMTAAVDLTPQMYLTSPRWEAHETLHLEDLSRQIGEYLGDVTTRRFISRDDCRGVGTFEAAVFTLRLDLFSKRSNRRLR